MNKQIKVEPLSVVSRLVPAAKRETRAQFAILKKTVDQLVEQQRCIESVLADLSSQVAKLHNHNAELSRDLKAVLRGLYLDRTTLDYPFRLTAGRFGAMSQNEEDGITLALFKSIGTQTKRFVEVACGSNGGNSGFLAKECGWSGLMIDGNERNISHIKEQFNPERVTSLLAWVTCENINSLLSRHGLSGEIDLLSLDIDGVDYWIWEALTVCSPRLVIVEYNSVFGPEKAVAVPYAPDFNRHKTGSRFYYGASLAAFNHLAGVKGYRLVATESRGVNAYFLRNDVAPEIPRCDVRAVFQWIQNPKGKKDGQYSYELASGIAGLPLVSVMEKPRK
jgi:hypothetical protein